MTTVPSIEPLKGTISSYTILPITLPSPPCLKNTAPATHYLYLRRHAPKVPTADDDRTFFAVNIPIDATETHFRALFTNISGGSGRVESVEFDSPRRKPAAELALPAVLTKTASKKRKRGELEDNGETGELPAIWDRELHTSGSTALIVFVDKPALDATLKALKPYVKGKDEPPVWGEGVEDKVPALGFQRYLNHHKLRFPPKEVLQASVDAYMTRYNALETARARALAHKKSVPDEDGFVTVVRGAKPNQEEVKERLEEKQKGVFLGDFYRFQVREERKKEVEGLRRRFEEDRRKVGEMRSRRFRPQ